MTIINYSTCKDCHKPITREDPVTRPRCCLVDCGWYHVNMADTLACKGTSVHVRADQPEWAKPGEHWARTPQGGWYQINRPAFAARGDDDAAIVAAERAEDRP